MPEVREKQWLKKKKKPYINTGMSKRQRNQSVLVVQESIPTLIKALFESIYGILK